MHGTGPQARRLFFIGESVSRADEKDTLRHENKLGSRAHRHATQAQRVKSCRA